MKFSIDYPRKSELTDTVEDEHPKRMAAVAEGQIRHMHQHQDGSAVELHEVGSKEFIQQAISSSLEGKISFQDSEWQRSVEQQKQAQLNHAEAMAQYDRKPHDLLGKGQSKTEMYGEQQTVTGLSMHRQETMMMGCNCGAEWTVTGVSLKDGSGDGLKIQQYNAVGGASSGYARNTGEGGGPGEYKTGAGTSQTYKG